MKYERYQTQLEPIRLILAYQAEKGDKLTESEMCTLLKIRSLASTHRKYCESYCNNGNQEQFDKDTARIEKAINKQIDSLNKQVKQLITVTYQGDPRGYTVKLHFPRTKPFNTWGGVEEGYGV